MRFFSKVGHKIADGEIADSAIKICCKVKFIRHLVQNRSKILEVAELYRRRSDIANHPDGIDKVEISFGLFVFKTQVKIGTRLAGFKDQVFDIETFLAKQHVTHRIVEHQPAFINASKRMDETENSVVFNLNVAKSAVNTVNIKMSVVHAQFLRTVFVLIPEDDMTVIQPELLHFHAEIRVIIVLF